MKKSPPDDSYRNYHDLNACTPQDFGRFRSGPRPMVVNEFDMDLDEFPMPALVAIDRIEISWTLMPPDATHIA